MASIYFEVEPMSGSGNGTIAVIPSGTNDTYYDRSSTITISNGAGDHNINAVHYGIPHIYLEWGDNVYPATGGTKMFGCTTHYPVWFRSVPDWIHITDTSGGTWNEGDIIPAEIADNVEFIFTADENYYPVPRNTGSRVFSMAHQIHGEMGIPIEYLYLEQLSGTDDTYIILTPPELRWNSDDLREKEIVVQCNHDWTAEFANDQWFYMRISGNSIFVTPVSENLYFEDYIDSVIVRSRSVSASTALRQTCEANDYYLRANPSSVVFDENGISTSSAITISTNLPQWSASLSAGSKFYITTGASSVTITATGRNDTLNDFLDTLIITGFVDGETYIVNVPITETAAAYLRLMSGSTEYITYPYNYPDGGSYGSYSGNIYSAVVLTNMAPVRAELIDSASTKAPGESSYYTAFDPVMVSVSSSSGKIINVFCGWEYGSGDTQTGDAYHVPPFQIRKMAFQYMPSAAYKRQYFDLVLTNISIGRQYLISSSVTSTDSIIGVGPKDTTNDYGSYNSGATLVFNLRTAVLPTSFQLEKYYGGSVTGVTILDASGNTIVPGQQVNLLPLDEETLKTAPDYPIRLVIDGTDEQRYFYFGAKYEYPNGDSGTCFTQTGNNPKDRFLIVQNGLRTPYYDKSTFENPFYIWDTLPSYHQTNGRTIKITGFTGSFSVPKVDDFEYFTKVNLSSSNSDLKIGLNPYYDNGDYFASTYSATNLTDYATFFCGYVNALKYPQPARTEMVTMSANGYSTLLYRLTQYAQPKATMDGDELAVSSATSDVIIKMDSGSTYTDTIDFVGTDPFTYTFTITSRCSDEGNLKLIDGNGNLVDSYSESGMGATLRYNFPALSDPDGTTMSVQIDVSEAKGATWRRRIWFSRGGNRCLPVTGGTFYYPTPV